MSDSPKLKVLFRLFILCALVTCLWFFSNKATSKITSQNAAPFERQIQVTTNQIQPDKGIIPVELKCENAELSAPNAIEKLSCVIKNNTQKYITAGSLYTSITVEQEGKTFAVSTYDVFDTFLHPDFRADHTNNLIAPGKEYRLNDLPVTYDNNVLVKGITVQIDYLEFADNSMLGPNRAGSRIVGDMREGAAKYKNWIAQKYKEKGKSIEAIIPLLDADQPLAEELGI